jgi:hypothetical protein
MRRRLFPEDELPGGRLRFGITMFRARPFVQSGLRALPTSTLLDAPCDCMSRATSLIHSAEPPAASPCQTEISFIPTVLSSAHLSARSTSQGQPATRSSPAYGSHSQRTPLPRTTPRRSRIRSSSWNMRGHKRGWSIRSLRTCSWYGGTKIGEER